MIGSGTLFDGLYKLNLDNLYVETLMTLHHSVGTKRDLVDKCVAYLWHKRLGHISKERMERLVKIEILPNLDFSDLNVCVDCIKGKQTKHTKKGATRSTQLLKIIHTDICGPFEVNSFNKEKYFNNFIGEYYGRYDKSGQHPGLFAMFLEKRGICSQYTMLGMPKQNGVSERHNQTLMDMVRSMLSNSSTSIVVNVCFKNCHVSIE